MTQYIGRYQAGSLRLFNWASMIVIAACAWVGCHPTTGATTSRQQEDTTKKSLQAPPQFLASSPDSTLEVTDENREEVFQNFDKYFHRGINVVDLEIEATCDEIRRVCGLKHIRFLDIHYGFCERYPAEMFDQPQLRMLRLFIPYTTTTIPEEISQLRGLSSLTIIGPDVNTLPKSLTEMKLLTGLDIAETSIYNLPLWLGEIKTLKRINVPYDGETALIENLEEFKKVNPGIEIN